jgi:hypothetical protein
MVDVKDFDRVFVKPSVWYRPTDDVTLGKVHGALVVSVV